MPRGDTPDVATDESGYLIDPADWTEGFAERAAREEGITLTDDHWAVIRFMRQWREEHGVAPGVRHPIAFLKQRGHDRNALFRLFPYGYVQQACRIAGMKKPRAWSTG